MNPLPPPNHYHLSAAVGWLELGDADEGVGELTKIAPEFRGHPDVLEIEWRLLAEKGEWEASLKSAETMIRAAPERPSGWIHRSYSLHEMRRTQEAMGLLLPVEKKFPDEHIIPYNLACYAAQLKNVPEAWVWLEKAISIGGPETIKTMALQDEDLKALWPAIERL